MRGRIWAVLGISLILVAEAGADQAVEKDLAEAVKTLNDAFAKGDAETIERLMSADHVAILSVGVRHTKAAALKTLGDLKFTSYATEDLKVTMLGKEAALLAYRAVIKGTFHGKPYPEYNYAVAVWAKRDGKWIETYYQETAAAKK